MASKQKAKEGEVGEEQPKVLYRIRDLASSERPRERLEHFGAEVLSTAELLAVLLRVGLPGENAVQLGQRLLATFGGLSGIHRASFQELQAQRGVGTANAAQIKAAIELGRRVQSASLEERVTITSPEDVARLVWYEMSALPQEHLWVILTDTRNRVLHIERLYKGTLNASTVRISEVFRPAIQRNAAAIVVVHNHPSGDPTPSPEDIALTRALIQAGRLLDIEVLDHLVIGQGQQRYVSLKQRGLAFAQS